MGELGPIRSDTPKVWEEPAIVLERSLEAAAQGGPPSAPGGAPQGYLGPLGLSPSSNGQNCG